MLSAPLSPSSVDINTAITAFLKAILPSDVLVLQGQANRVAEPKQGDFVVFWPLMRNSLATNLDIFTDGAFTGSIADNLLTITAVDPNFTQPIKVGSSIYGVGVANVTSVTALGTGTGGVGTYTVTPGGQTVSSEKLSAGVEELTKAVELVVQIDAHGPNSDQNAHLISTFMRDGVGVDLIQGACPYMVPLEADDVKQMPFINEQNQYENRYTLDARFQVNITASIGQQFADELHISAIIDVDVVYPPT